MMKFVEDVKVKNNDRVTVRQEVRKDNYRVQGDKNIVNETENENKDNEKECIKSIKGIEGEGSDTEKKGRTGREKDDKVVRKVNVKCNGSEMVLDRHQSRNENEGERNEVKTNINESKDNVEINETKKDETNKSEEHKQSQKRKHKHKHKNKGQHGNEQRHVKVKKQKVDIENKENTKMDTNDKMNTDANVHTEECSVTLSDSENNSGTQTPLQDERQISLQGELPIVTEILKTKLNQENQKVKPKKVSYSEYLSKKGDSQKTEIGNTYKQFNLVRDEHNIWRRKEVPVSESNAAKWTTKRGNGKPNKIETEKNYEFDMFAGVPNRYELSKEMYETELFYDPEGKVEVNTESSVGVDSDIGKEETRSGEETPLMDEAEVRESEKVVLNKDSNNNNVTDKQRQNMEKQRQNTEKQRQNMDRKETNTVAPKQMTVASQKDTKLQELACDILITGVMPLCPPGRRDWGEVTQYDLAELNFKWPPTNWSMMSPDRRLLAWEFAAMSLEQSTEGSVDPSSSRAYLLDKFNFLALPGTPKHVKDREEVAASRARFYTYQMVREVASGKLVTGAVEAQLRCLEGVRKVSDDFKLRLRTIDAPLRLKLE